MTFVTQSTPLSVPEYTGLLEDVMVTNGIRITVQSQAILEGGNDYEKRRGPSDPRASPMRVLFFQDFKAQPLES